MLAAMYTISRGGVAHDDVVEPSIGSAASDAQLRTFFAAAFLRGSIPGYEPELLEPSAGCRFSSFSNNEPYLASERSEQTHLDMTIDLDTAGDHWQLRLDSITATAAYILAHPKHPFLHFQQ